MIIFSSSIIFLLLVTNSFPITSSANLYDTRNSKFQPLTSLSSIAADVSWEFTDGLEGWASATYNEMQAEVYHKNGEMRIKVNGGEPHFDSPPLFLPIGNETRHAVVIRYRYIGRCRQGKIRLRGGTSISDFVVDYGHNNWDRQFSNNSTNYFSPEDIIFSIVGDGKWKIAYAYLYQSFNGNLTQMRIWPAAEADDVSPNKGNSFHIDWVRIVRAPIIERIKGCHGEKYSNFIDFHEEDSNVETKSLFVNGSVFLKKHQTIWKDSNEYRYSKVYNCLREGGERIIIEGKNLGVGGLMRDERFVGAPALIYIDKKPCTNVQHDNSRPQERLTCITPAAMGKASPTLRESLVELKNGKLPGLFDTSSFFSYASLPPKPVDIKVANIASRSIDLHWKVGGSVWNHMTQTGFLIQWGWRNFDTWESIITGNVSCTTIRNLLPNTSYYFGISSLTENQALEQLQDLNMYGQRKKQSRMPLLQSFLSIINTKTLPLDVSFDNFNANSTHNYGPLDKEQNALGPTGISSGEGHYGLSLVGDVNIENCNASSTCCDTYDDDIKSCASASCFCHKGHSSFNISGFNVSNTCGPALRLTGSHAGLKGAAWYNRQLEVSEGFDTEFAFRMSNPSYRCNNMNNVQTNCRYRGADGFSFVIQAETDQEIGGYGKNMGYGGIKNSIAIEFDTYHNFEELDPYENHISVNTRGKYPNSPNHQYSLGYTNALSDLSNGNKRVRIKYIPRFDQTELGKPSFMASPYILNFFQKSNFSSNPLSDWENQIGMLYIYFENLIDPILVVPLNLAATLKLNYGRAWVGFTSSTGSETWQVHDILEWKFSSLRSN